jgi:hypothetical protein
VMVSHGRLFLAGTAQVSEKVPQTRRRSGHCSGLARVSVCGVTAKSLMVIQKLQS